MNLGPVPSLLLTVAIFGGFWFLIYWLRRREAVAVCNGFLAAGSPDARVKGDDTVIGTVQGVRLTYTIYQGGKHSPGHTTVEAPAPGEMPACEIHLSPQTATDTRLVQRGREIDVEVGDPQFDAEVVVEAAPAEVVRAVLDPHLRSRVRMMMPCNVHVAGGTVTLRKTRKITNMQDVGTLLQSVVYLHGRLGQVAGELGAERMAALGQQGAGGYRGVGPGGASAAFAPPGAMEELARLQQVRGDRARRGRMVSFLFMGVIFGGWILMALVASSSRRSSSASHPTPPKPTTAATKPAPTATSTVSFVPGAGGTPGGAAKPGTFRDTEGRSFYERGGMGATAFVDPALASTVPLSTPDASLGTPAFGLWFDTHFVRVCDGHRSGTTLNAVPEACRPVTCNADGDCPLAKGASTMVECIHGWCGVRAAPMEPSDVVAACLAGTGPDWRSPAQKTLIGKAKACKSSPCAVPAECKVP